MSVQFSLVKSLSPYVCPSNKSVVGICSALYVKTEVRIVLLECYLTNAYGKAWFAINATQLTQRQTNTHRQTDEQTERETDFITITVGRGRRCERQCPSAPHSRRLWVALQLPVRAVTPRWNCSSLSGRPGKPSRSRLDQTTTLTDRQTHTSRQTYRETVRQTDVEIVPFCSKGKRCYLGHVQSRWLNKHKEIWTDRQTNRKTQTLY